MVGLKFAESHNLAIFLVDSPASHGEFKSMIHGLKKYCLASALTLDLVVYQSMIQEFWKTIVVKKGMMVLSLSKLLLRDAKS